ncbi:MAG: thioredoxin [Candidatus Peribacteria bacterium]|jgi:thioredoxin 1|nr:thioredoxin [Candidatus Peribacteria bacterium]
MTNTIRITSKEQFKTEVAQGMSVIDFYADRCGPCKMLAPIMEELQADNASKGVKILKVNVDENPDLAAEFGVSSIPTVFFSKNGKIVEGMVGANPKSVYQEKIDSYLAEGVGAAPENADQEHMDSHLAA